MKTKNIFIFIFLIFISLFFISLIKAEIQVGNVGKSGVNLNKNIQVTNINYSNLNVNDSMFWQGHTGNNASWLNNILWSSLVNIPTYVKDWTSSIQSEIDNSLINYYNKTQVDNNLSKYYLNSNPSNFINGTVCYSNGTNCLSSSSGDFYFANFSSSFNSNNSINWNKSQTYNSTEIDNNLSLRYLSTNPNNYLNITTINNNTILRNDTNINIGYNITAIYLIGNGSKLTSVCLSNGSNCVASSGGNSSWNESYASTKYAQYNFTTNSFNGSGNFVTTGSIKNLATNSKHYFGASSSASIYYDGTNFIINPQEVGSGYTHFSLGSVYTNNINSRYNFNVMKDINTQDKFASLGDSYIPTIKGSNLYNTNASLIDNNIIYDYEIPNFNDNRFPNTINLKYGYNPIALLFNYSTMSSRYFNITLISGNNLIGISQKNPISIYNLIFSNATGNYTYNQSLNNGILSSPIKKSYDISSSSGNYEVNILLPQNAYWVNTNQAVVLYFGNSTSDSMYLGTLPNQTYPWTQLRFSNGSTELNITQAISSNWIQSCLKYYSSGSFRNFCPANPPYGGNKAVGSAWEGYFLYSYFNNIRLIVDNSNFTSYNLTMSYHSSGLSSYTTNPNNIIFKNSLSNFTFGNNGINFNGTYGISRTLNLINSSNNVTCTAIFYNGLYTGGTC